MPAGRPTEYTDDILPTVAELALSGATDRDIADSLDVNVSTLYRWKVRYPALREALKDSKDECDSVIERTLYQKARDGDTTAMIFWLKNRKSAEWRDKRDYEHSGEVGITRILLPDRTQTEKSKEPEAPEFE